MVKFTVSTCLLGLLLAGHYAQGMIHGSATSPGEIPYQVALQTNGHNFCGGSIINDRWILSAAHCFALSYASFSDRTVAKIGGYFRNDDLEGPNVTYHRIDAVVIPDLFHCKFFVKREINRTSKCHSDVALLRTAYPIEFSEAVQPVKLSDGPENFTGQLLEVTGWGSQSTIRLEDDYPEVLMKSQYEALSEQECSKELELSEGCYNPRHELCVRTNGNSACYGDSGGPVVTPDGIQVGIVSHLMHPKHGKKNQCNSPLPNVHTRVSFFLPWIQGVMKNKTLLEEIDATSALWTTPMFRTKYPQEMGPGLVESGSCLKVKDLEHYIERSSGPAKTSTEEQPTEGSIVVPTEARVAKPTEGPIVEPTEAPAEKPTEAPVEKLTEVPKIDPPATPAEPATDIIKNSSILKQDQKFEEKSLSKPEVGPKKATSFNKIFLMAVGVIAAVVTMLAVVLKSIGYLRSRDEGSDLLADTKTWEYCEDDEQL